MKPKGILFQDWGVSAIRVGWKTQTRRPMKPQPPDDCGGLVEMDNENGKFENDAWMDYSIVAGILAERDGVSIDTYDLRNVWSPPYGPAGRVLYVKQAQMVRSRDRGDRKRSALFMPMKDAEIWLRVTEIRAQRVQEISAQDATAEGIVGTTPIHAFDAVWDSIHGPGAWERNDWVWAYTFERIERPKED